MLEKTLRLMKIGLVSVPFSKGNGRLGSEEAPAAILQRGLLKSLTNYDSNPNLDVKICEKINCRPKKIAEKVPLVCHFAEFVGCIEEVSKTVQNVIEDDRLCITLGGDHSIAAGTLDGHIKAKNENVCVLWIDAHCDINTPKTSYTGHPHGMPVSLMMKELASYWKDYPGIDWRKPAISSKNLAYIGLRSVDDYERLILDKLGIAAYSMEAVDDLGIKEVIQRALHKVDAEKCRSIHVSFDIDALDPLEAPSTGTPVRGGLTMREGIQIVEAAYNTGRLGAFDLCEVNPKVGGEEDVKRTLDAAINLIKAATGHKRSGKVPVNTTEIPT